MENEQKLKWWELSPKGVKMATVIIAGVVVIIWLLTSCGSLHGVTQSSQSSQYVKGDTTVTEVKITYEQTGKISR